MLFFIILFRPEYDSHRLVPEYTLLLKRADTEGLDQKVVVSGGTRYSESAGVIIMLVKTDNYGPETGLIGIAQSINICRIRTIDSYG